MRLGSQGQSAAPHATLNCANCGSPTNSSGSNPPMTTFNKRYVAVIEFYQGTLSLERAIYGDGNPQIHTLMSAARTGSSHKRGS
jgi:hypothetical protein